MSKHVASFFLAAACALGCRNVLQRAGPAAHVAASSPDPAVPFQANGMAQLSERAPSLAPAQAGPPRASDGEWKQARTKPQERKGQPAVPEKKQPAVAVVGGHPPGTADHVAREAPANAGRQVIRATADAKTIAPPRARTSPKPEKGMARAKPPARLLEKVPSPDRRAEGLYPQLWYGAASVLGALFAYILAPLMVEFMKHRLGFGRHPSEWAKPVPRAGPPCSRIRQNSG